MLALVKTCLGFSFKGSVFLIGSALIVGLNSFGSSLIAGLTVLTVGSFWLETSKETCLAEGLYFFSFSSFLTKPS